MAEYVLQISPKSLTHLRKRGAHNEDSTKPSYVHSRHMPPTAKQMQARNLAHKHVRKKQPTSDDLQQVSLRKLDKLLRQPSAACLLNRPLPPIPAGPICEKNIGGLKCRNLVASSNLQRMP